MPWYLPWSDSIKKRACRYLLQHYLEQFLQEKLTLDQLTVDLFNGKGIVKSVPLNVGTLNELLEGANIPLEILDGYIDTIAISVPWSSLMQENCELEIKGLEIVVGIKRDIDFAGSVNSETLVFTSMTSSLEIAQECLKVDESLSNEQTASQQTFEGLESFAQTIESVLSRVKVTFQNVMIRFEHLLPNKKSGIGLELHLERIDYSDLSSDVSEGSDQPSYDIFEPPSLAYKHLRIFGLKLSLDEFHENSRTLLRNTLFKDRRSPSPESLTSSPPLSLSPPLSPYQSALFTQSLTTNQNNQHAVLLPAVVILSSAGEQEAKVKWKLNSSCPGPKVDFEYFIGTLNVLMSPKQLHLLLELMDDINNLQNADLCSYSHSDGLVNKPMKAGDFHKIEKELNEQMMNKKSQPSGKIDSWNVCFDSNSSHPFDPEKIVDETIEEETFYSLTDMDQQATPLHEPTVKINGFPSTQGLVQKVSEAGIMPLNNQDNTKNYKSFDHPALSKLAVQNSGLAGISGLDDGANNTTKGLFKLSGLSLTLLLKDPVLLPGKSTQKSETSQDHPLCKIADRFFDQISSAAFGSKDVDQIQEKYNNACVVNHLRCFFATVNISCEISNTLSSQSLTVEATVGLLKLVECLVEYKGERTDLPQHQLTQLLKLSERKEHQLHDLGTFQMSAKPCLKARYKSIQRSCSPASIQGRHSVIPKTEVDIKLGDAEVELDITLTERLHDILYPSSTTEYEEQGRSSSQYFTAGGVRSDINQQALFSRTMNDGSFCDQKIHIHVTCPNITASLRFPVPDLHQPDHCQMNSSWRKSLRKEVCLLKCTDVAFETTLQHNEDVTSYEVRFKDLNGYLQFYNDKNEPVPFVRVGQRHTENDADSNGFDLPRIIFHVQSSVSGLVLEEPSTGNDSPDSLSDTCSMFKSEPSPFSSKPVMHNEEELVVPGDTSEMKDFQGKTSSLSKFHLEINFPEIDINLHDQSFFELIYNRFGNDLLLWEPFNNFVENKPKFDVTVNNTTGVDFASGMTHRFSQSNFKMCHSTVNRDSCSSDEDESDSSEQLKSLHTIQETPKSTIALSLNTSKAKVVLFPHSKIDGQNGLGKIMLHFDNAEIFYVLDYKGQVNLCYTSVQAKYCSLRHAFAADTVSSNMDTVFDSGNLYRTIYESDPGLKVTGSKSNVEENRRMFLVAVKSFLDTERNSKEFVVAISLFDATLRHRVVHEGQMWLMQMIDFFCVTDEEILGYVPPVVVTMLHFHFWNCAVHYRPLYIPYQLLITFEGFNVCSNITADSKASILRFIIDNAVLLISKSQEETIDLIKDYVSVADVDLFELSLHTVNDVEKASPKLALTLSNNIVHIRTCSDTLCALVEMIRYFADNGDFQKDETVVPASTNTDEKKDEAFNDCPVEQRGAEDVSLHDLMSEAMVECNTSNNKHCLADEPAKELITGTSPKLDVFDFPGDSSIMTPEDDDCSATTSADYCNEDDGDDDYSDDEFCILDHPQKEQEVIYDEPKVKCSGDEIKIVPDHFSVPVGGVDQLKAPSNYPIPLYCYTIKEMSVIWQLYGGRDFNENKNDKKEKMRDEISNDVVENGAMLSGEDEMDEDPVIIDSREKKKKKAVPARVSWKTNAGVARDLNTLVEVQLTKVRFQYEDYPEDTKQAWRQVFLVQDVEIRDRLSSSQINKLLYQYSTEARPKQTHANMVSVKTLGVRPDLLLSSQEGCLRISLKPLRLNIDQDTLQFLITFCKELSNTDEMTPSQDPCLENPPPAHVSSTPDLPVTRVTPSIPENAPPTNAPIFFRLFEFSPEVPIRLDYHGKHMDMGQRSLAGVLFAFAQLNCSEIRLRRLCQRSGLLGFDKVVSYALNEWASDIKKKQIPGILGGVGPTHSFVQLVQGVKDLFWLPVEQYRRDGRIIRGLQRGASSFTTSSAMAFLEMTNKLVQVVHGAAEVAYDMVSPEPSSSSRGHAIKRRVSQQPADVRQGVANAYNVVTEGFGQTAINIVQVAMEEHENRGLTGAVGGVLRHIPSVVVQPIILATEATSNVLGGVRNQILPDARREATEKWRLDEQ